MKISHPHPDKSYIAAAAAAAVFLVAVIVDEDLFLDWNSKIESHVLRSGPGSSPNDLLAQKLISCHPMKIFLEQFKK